MACINLHKQDSNIAGTRDRSILDSVCSSHGLRWYGHDKKHAKTMFGSTIYIMEKKNQMWYWVSKSKVAKYNKKWTNSYVARILTRNIVDMT